MSELGWGGTHAHAHTEHSWVLLRLFQQGARGHRPGQVGRAGACRLPLSPWKPSGPDPERDPGWELRVLESEASCTPHPTLLNRITPWLTNISFFKGWSSCGFAELDQKSHDPNRSCFLGNRAPCSCGKATCAHQGVYVFRRLADRVACCRLPALQSLSQGSTSGGGLFTPTALGPQRDRRLLPSRRRPH